MYIESPFIPSKNTFSPALLMTLYFKFSEHILSRVEKGIYLNNMNSLLKYSAVSPAIFFFIYYNLVNPIYYIDQIFIGALWKRKSLDIRYGYYFWRKGCSHIKFVLTNYFIRSISLQNLLMLTIIYLNHNMDLSSQDHINIIVNLIIFLYHFSFREFCSFCSLVSIF